MCLRCHDGTIARDTLDGSAGQRFVNTDNPGLFGTGHGTSEHPVGVDYPQLDRGFRPATAVVASGTVTLPDGKVECISCHDPHDMAGEKHMLVVSNARSALCLTCHRK
jgi:predicted CXXCH cytochrome family protein